MEFHLLLLVMLAPSETDVKNAEENLARDPEDRGVHLPAVVSSPA